MLCVKKLQILVLQQQLIHITVSYVCLDESAWFVLKAAPIFPHVERGFFRVCFNIPQVWVASITQKNKIKVWVASSGKFEQASSSSTHRNGVTSSRSHASGLLETEIAVPTAEHYQPYKNFKWLVWDGAAMSNRLLVKKCAFLSFFILGCWSGPNLKMKPRVRVMTFPSFLHRI